MSDLDKLLCDPDQFLSSFSSTFNSGASDSICGTSLANFQVNESFQEPISSTLLPSSVPSSLSNISGTTSQLMTSVVSDLNLSKPENTTSSLVDILEDTSSILDQPSLLPESGVPSAVMSSSEQKSDVSEFKMLVCF